MAADGQAIKVTIHLVLHIRHVDQHDNVIQQDIQFVVLPGLRYPVVLGLYALSMYFTDVVVDLLECHKKVAMENEQRKASTVKAMMNSTPIYTDDDENIFTRGIETILEAIPRLDRSAVDQILQILEPLLTPEDENLTVGSNPCETSNVVQHSNIASPTPSHNMLPNNNDDKEFKRVIPGPGEKMCEKKYSTFVCIQGLR